MDEKRISFEECGAKLGHCWQDDTGFYFSTHADQKQRCRHCGATRHHVPDWQEPKPSAGNAAAPALDTERLLLTATEPGS